MGNASEPRVVPFGRTKVGQLVLCAGAIVVAAFGVAGFLRMSHKAETEVIVKAIAAANKEFSEASPGMARAEEYVSRLRAAAKQPGPADVKAALSNYMAAWEKGLAAMKAGETTATADDSAIEEAKQQLTQVVQRYY